MDRPGYLSGFESFTPRAAKRSRLSGFRTLGAFGKGFVAPPPPPSGAAPGAVSLTSAYNVNTNQYYVQDPRCPEGESEQDDKCSGDDCCDIVGTARDCDPEGTIYGKACNDDPSYREFPEDTWTTCEQLKAAFHQAGIPEKFAQDICKEDDIPTQAEFEAEQRNQATYAQPQQQQAPTKKAAPKPSCPPGKIPSGSGCAYPPCPTGQVRKGPICEYPPCPPNHKREGPKCLPPCPQSPCNRPPPQNAKCRVPGYGYKNLICKTVGHGTKCRTDWMCPNGMDIRMGRTAGKWKAPAKKAPAKKAAPKAKALQGYFGDTKPNNWVVYGLGALLLFSVVKSAK